MQMLMEGGCWVFILDKQLSAENAQELRGLFEEARARGGGPFVVDMSHLQYIDSSGLGALVYLLRHSSGGARLCCVSPKIQKMLELARLDQFFSIYPSREEAIEGVQWPPIW